MKNFIIGFLTGVASAVVMIAAREVKEGFDKDRGEGQKVEAPAIGFKG